jgi:hypothetical protein
MSPALACHGMRRRIAGGVIAASAVAALAAGASGSTSRTPLNTVLRGAWFNVAMHGQYAMSWSGQVNHGCGPGEAESFTGSVSQTISFETRHSVRRWAYEAAVFDRQLHRRVTYLVISNRYRAPGTKIGPNGFGSARLATPALFTRSATGTYVECGGPAHEIRDIPCPRVVVPSLRAVVRWTPFRPSGRAAPSFDTEEGTNQTPYPGKCASAEEDDVDGVLGPAGVPNLQQDHLNAFLPAPRSARFMTAPPGAVITSRFHGNPFGWSPSYSQLTVKLTFRRVR